MNHLFRIIACSAALLLGGGAQRGITASPQDSAAVKFIGSTPGNALVREFLGGLAGHAPCDSIIWQLTLLTNQNTGQPSVFKLNAHYQVPVPHNTNHSQSGPKVTVQGKWEILRGAKSSPETVVYRITADAPARSLSFVKVGEHLLHLLNRDGSLAVGNGGYSYTLNHASHSENPADVALARSAPSISYKISSLATGPTVFAVFEGRSPCLGISRELKLPQHAGCIKAKWRVTLYQNPETSAPTTYKVEGSLFRDRAREGTWSRVRGASTDPNATVYQLDAAQTQPALLLMKGDDNVLFFLNQNREPLIGHGEFSYTLNRVAAK